MPKYDYYCPANDQVVEVRHSMMTEIKTWGELCEHLGQDPGNINPLAHVEKLMSGGTILTSKRSGSHHCGGDCDDCGGNCSCHH